MKTAAKDIEIVLTEAPAGDRNANGSIEVVIRDEKRQSRALLSELEENLGKLEDTHTSITHVVESARSNFA